MEAIIEHINSEKGYGFLKVEGYEKNVFFHAKDLIKISFDQLQKGDAVSIGEIEDSPKGQCAKKVSLAI